MLKRIKAIVDKYPKRVAYKVNNKSITYSRLWELANYYADFLRRQGTSPVIIWGDKDIDVIVSILACIIANRTYVPVGFYVPLFRLKKIINMTNSSLILSENIIDIENVDCVNLRQLKKYVKYELQIQNNNIAYIIFTSGSTSEPKGVPISYDNLNNFIKWISNIRPLNEYKNICVLNQASFSFDLSVADLYYSLCNGHTLIAYDGNIQVDSLKLFDLMKEIDVAVMTPTFMKFCLLNDEFNSKNYPKFKCVYFCGERLDIKIVDKLFLSFPKLQVINAYGPTEATSAVSSIRITSKMVNSLKLLPAGEIKKAATEIEIINKEIILKGKSVFGGYLNNYQGGYYIENGINCYRTGDIGYIENGKLYCKGRKDNQIKYKGYRIELDEIENNINLIDGVKQCAVIVKKNKDLTVKSIKGFIVVNEEIDANYIRKELLKYLPKYMIPNVIKIVDKLPINKNGKIDRKVLSKL